MTARGHSPASSSSAWSAASRIRQQHQGLRELPKRFRAEEPRELRRARGYSPNRVDGLQHEWRAPRYWAGCQGRRVLMLMDPNGSSPPPSSDAGLPPQPRPGLPVGRRPRAGRSRSPSRPSLIASESSATHPDTLAARSYVGGANTKVAAVANPLPGAVLQAWLRRRQSG
jgi:hypothetical protein